MGQRLDDLLHQRSDRHRVLVARNGVADGHGHSDYVARSREHCSGHMVAVAIETDGYAIMITLQQGTSVPCCIFLLLCRAALGVGCGARDYPAAMPPRRLGNEAGIDGVVTALVSLAKYPGVYESAYR